MFEISTDKYILIKCGFISNKYLEVKLVELHFVFNTYIPQRILLISNSSYPFPNF